ncbi:DUF1153 domain-containing protein [Ferrovibrio sp.]|uniref:CtrA inhibitor SciP n=1 Tax=Ferrovibrio sp. TaxID=1917215 RepID=UPI00311E00DB
MLPPQSPQASVIGPEGQRITRDTLPSPNTKRWVIRRKAEVVAAVRGGLLTLEEACQRYALTTEEFLSWQRAIEQHGLPGLRTTRLQDYRAAPLRVVAARPPAGE